MTVQELYQNINGDYEQAMMLMQMDPLIDRCIRKFRTSGMGEALQDAAQTLDEPRRIFESAHSMKGVCANLGLNKLSAQVSLITEEFRPGNERKMTDEEVRQKLAEINDMYENTKKEILRYEEDN